MTHTNSSQITRNGTVHNSRSFFNSHWSNTAIKAKIRHEYSDKELALIAAIIGRRTKDIAYILDPNIQQSDLTSMKLLAYKDYDSFNKRYRNLLHQPGFTRIKDCK